ncbi:MAG TPA: FIST N-terminal domain-containing protein [Thermoanaerobaculia bacterium]|nr:FIST N-terminal domain-containing protein [Thermoanaerobaculia bacterium]
MKVEQCRRSAAGSWSATPGDLRGVQLVLAFGSRELCVRGEASRELAAAYPDACVVGCSTAGEICGTEVTDDTLVSTAVAFEGTTLRRARVDLAAADSSHAAGQRLAASLPREGLVHVVVLSEGLEVNGSELVRGITASLPPAVTVTGGLSGDGERFAETRVICDGEAQQGTVVAIGFYGQRLRVGYASLGGWDPFGPERRITRSRGNVLYELDGRSALELYQRYLGEHAAGLPASGLLFPLSLRTAQGGPGVVRTILGVDRAAHSLTFAGDMPEGAYARLMKANFDRLIDGAVSAARTSYEAVGAATPEMALLISCVGRKMVLKQRIEEEVEAVREVLGAGVVLAGFYSYGEISPFTPDARCELHNQTMTITTFAER